MNFGAGADPIRGRAGARNYAAADAFAVGTEAIVFKICEAIW